MLVNYVAPIVALGVTYTRVGVELWGSQAIGERTTRQEDSVRSKRRVRNKDMSNVAFTIYPNELIAFKLINIMNKIKKRLV